MTRGWAWTDASQCSLWETWYVGNFRKRYPVRSPDNKAPHLYPRKLPILAAGQQPFHLIAFVVELWPKYVRIAVVSSRPRSWSCGALRTNNKLLVLVLGRKFCLRHQEGHGRGLDMAWDEAEELATDTAEWHQRVAKCIDQDAGWIKV